MKLTLYHKINFINESWRYLTYKSIHKIFTNKIELKCLKKKFKFQKQKNQNFEISP